METMTTATILPCVLSVFTPATLASAGISCHSMSLSVPLSVTNRVLLKRLNVGSRKQRHTSDTTAQALFF